MTIEAKSGNTIDLNGGGAATFTTQNDGIDFVGGTLFIQDTALSATINSNNGTVKVNSVDGDEDEDLTIDAGTGSIEIGRIGGDNGTNDEGINTVSLTAATEIKLSGNITTSDAANNDVTFSGPVVISGAVTIDTDPGSATDGDVEFTKTIRGDNSSSTTDALVIETGSGALTFHSTNTIIGGGSRPLASLDINITGGTGNVVALDIPQIGTTGGTVAGVSGTVRIGNAATQTLTMSDALYNFGTGDVTLSALSTGSGTTFNANDTDVNTSGGSITINGDVVGSLVELDIDTTANSGTSGTIKITGDITAKTGGGADEILVLNAGSGKIDLGGAVGATTSALKSVTLSSTNTAADAVKLAGNIKTSATAGAIDITGPVTIAATDLVIDADQAATTVTFASTSTVNATSAGTQGLTINTGAGNISMGGAIGGTTKLKDLSINSATTGAGDITLANIGSSTDGVHGATSIGNTNTGTINLNGSVYKTVGSQTYQASATLSLIHI